MQQVTLFSGPVTAAVQTAKRRGRKPLYLTEPELTEAIQYFTTNNPSEKQRLLQKFSKKRLRHALAICKLDMGKQGQIFRTPCPTHKREHLIYNWDNKEGVRVRCKVSGCEFNTHFMPFLFTSEEAPSC